MRPLLLHFEESTSAKSTDAKKTARDSEMPMTEIQRIVAGTKTISEILAEANDVDPHAQNRNGLAIPI